MKKEDFTQNLTFEKYYTNEYGVYLSEEVASDIEFDDPMFDVSLTDQQVKEKRKRILTEIATRLVPDIKTLYVNFR